MHIRLALTTAFAASALVGCARSGEVLSEEQEAALAQASDDAAAALQGTEENGQAIEDLEGRVDAVEDAVENGGNNPDVDQLEMDVADLGTDVATLEGRVDMLEDSFPVTDDEVLVDDRAAAGFPDAAPIDNVEQGMSYLNQRIDVQDIQLSDLGNEIDAVAGAISSLEVAFGSNLFTTVENVITENVNAGNITVEADLSFDPVPDISPLADPADTVVPYNEATDYGEAIRALRYANQSRYIPKPSDTRLGGLARNYVQEAIDKLDEDVYDVIYGNIAIDLNAGTTVDGTDLDVYVSSVVENDTTLLETIFSSQYFTDAITNVINNGGLGGVVTASSVTVDPALLGNPADYANVQLSLESLYAGLSAVTAQADQNAADIADLDGRVDATETSTATNTTAITNLTTAVNGNTTAITSIVGGADTNVTNLTTLQVAVNNINTGLAALSAADVAFDNTNHPAFDNNNNTVDVQVAIEDLHEQATAINASLAAIAAGGGTCEDGTTACTTAADCTGIGAGTCTSVVTDATNVLYNDNGQATVRDALDDLYATILTAQVVLNDGTYIFAGQDLNLAVEALDVAIANVAADLAAAEAAIVDLDTRLDLLEVRVTAAEAAIAANTDLINTSVTNLQNGINTNAAAITALDAQVDANAALLAQHTTAIGQNTTGVQNNATAIVDLDARVDALEAFNQNELANVIAEAVNQQIQNLIDTELAVINGRLDALEAAQADFANNPFILGPSAQSSDGKFQFGGETGVRAATAMCQTTFPDAPNAHLCTPDEVHHAVSLGNYTNTNFDDVWTWTVSGLSRRHGTIDAFTSASSLVTSCLNFLYNSGDAATGTRLRVRFNEVSQGNGGGLAGDQVVVEPNRGCNTSYPVLCCR